MKLLVHNAEHLRCSTIEKWYSAIKDKTPYTKIYEELPDVAEIEKDFSFPVFIKGNRQTNRHNKAQCIIENADAYEQLRKNWKNDNILSWQKVAVREYVKLQTIDDISYPEMVPISYEFRFFCFEGKCVGYGSYWYMGSKYTMSPDDSESAIKLAEWAAERVGVSFIAVDLAKTDKGDWIVIEVNDAQESGFVGLNSLSLWHNTIEAMQDRN
ncbi:MAG: ATP-grasp domain-containing protein [Dorea sp.]|nr:ATP-grasp domain-containing protein [Dorea sp.]